MGDCGRSVPTVATEPWFLAGLRFPCCSAARLVTQGELLHSPVHELRDVQRVRIAAVDGVDHPELLELLASLAETADHRTVQPHLVDLAIEKRILGRVGVGAVEKLLRAWRDADGTGGA